MSPSRNIDARSPSSGGEPPALARVLLVPFCMALFPAIHYLNRNLTTTRLPPEIEPTPTTLAVAALVALVGSAAFALITAALVRPYLVAPGTPADRGLLDHAIAPDNRSLAVYGAFLLVLAVFAVVALVGVGPERAALVLYVVVAPLGLPLLLLAPLAIGSHLAVVLGYAASPVWMAIVARAVVVAASRFGPSARERT